MLFSEIRSPYLKKFFQPYTFNYLREKFPRWILGKEQEIPTIPMMNPWIFVLSYINLIVFLITNSPLFFLLSTASLISVYYTSKKLVKIIDNLISAHKLPVTAIRLLATLAGAFYGFNFAADIHLVYGISFSLIGAASAIFIAKLTTKLFSYLISGHTNTGVDSISPAAWARITKEQNNKLTQEQVKEQNSNAASRRAQTPFGNGTLNVNLRVQSVGDFSDTPIPEALPDNVSDFAAEKFSDHTKLKASIGAMKGILAQLKSITTGHKRATLSNMYKNIKEGDLIKIEEYKNNFFINLYHYYRTEDRALRRISCEERALIADVFGVEYKKIDRLYGDSPTPSSDNRTEEEKNIQKETTKLAWNKRAETLFNK